MGNTRKSAKLSFIKLDIEIMNDTKIKVLRKMPGGNDLFILWIGILCLGMKSGKLGTLEIGDGIPFTDETLSAELDIDLNTVRLGLETFQKLKMIERFEDGTFYISNYEKHQELDRIKLSREATRKRVAESRRKAKLQIEGGHSGIVTVTDVLQSCTTDHCNASDIDKDKDIDKDIDKDKDSSVHKNICLKWYKLFNERKGLLTAPKPDNYKRTLEVIERGMTERQLSLAVDFYWSSECKVFPVWDKIKERRNQEIYNSFIGNAETIYCAMQEHCSENNIDIEELE